MTKPNTTFKLSIRDVEVIEQALRNKAGRRGMAIAQGDTSPELKAEMYEIQDVLGRIHEQKKLLCKIQRRSTLCIRLAYEYESLAVCRIFQKERKA